MILRRSGSRPGKPELPLEETVRICGCVYDVQKE